MKKLFSAAPFLILFTGCATELTLETSDVPQTVLNAYNQKYPAAQFLEWEVEKHKKEPMVFEVAFKLNGKRIEAVFKPDGTFIKEE